MRSTSGRRKTRTALLISLVTLSGSLETGALARQLREGRARNKPADFPLHHSSAHYSALTPTSLCLLYLFFFFSMCPFSFSISPVCQGSKGEAKKTKQKKGALPITFPHACSSVSLWSSRRQRLKFSPGAPLKLHSSFSQSLSSLNTSAAPLLSCAETDLHLYSFLPPFLPRHLSSLPVFLPPLTDRVLS